MAHTAMEIEKSHGLWSASWRPRKACDVVQTEPEGLKTREADGIIP